MECISNVSNALHTLGLETLEFNTTDSALSISAEGSMYIWVTPIPPVIEGILASFPTILTKLSPPLGIIRSMYSLS